LLAGLSGRAGAAPPEPIFPNVVGLWAGEYASSVTGTNGLVSLDVTRQLTRRFQGTWTFVPPIPIVPPSPCIVLGTVSESGEVSLVGRNDEFMLHARGELSLTDSMISLDYLVLFADGSFDGGTVQMSSIVIGDGGP
jgi:hypothetical protein